ncbi:unnamed protein product, partial [Didymodactylos carnosus]
MPSHISAVTTRYTDDILKKVRHGLLLPIL